MDTAPYTFTIETGETCEVVSTDALRTGDLVLNHDMRIRLGDVHVSPSAYGDVYCFDTIVENGEAIRAQENHITRGLLGADLSWPVQGNSHAQWARVVGA